MTTLDTRDRYVSDAHEVRELDEVVERLGLEFPAIDADLMRFLIDAHHEVFAADPIRAYIPIFVERAVRRDLLVGPVAEPLTR